MALLCPVSVVYCIDAHCARSDRSLPASALEESDDEEDEGVVDKMDDERTGTKYNYAWFHVIFILATMYTAMLLTNWCVAVLLSFLVSTKHVHLPPRCLS